MSDQAEPLEGELVPAGTRVSRTELVRRIATTNDADNAELDPASRQLYLDVYAQMVAEAEQVPGFGTGMTLMLERTAYLWAAQKAMEMREEPIEAQHYERLVQRFRQLWETTLKTRDDRQADEAFKRQFASAVVGAVGHVLETELPREQADAIQARILLTVQQMVAEGRR